MAGDIGYWPLLKKQFTTTKLFFHFVFWGLHWAVFAIGW